jgi:choline dehydrogenase-like flavoprotein
METDCTQWIQSTRCGYKHSVSMSAGHYDHIVIGAGISGSSSAYQMAKRGAKVLLLEKVKMPNILYKAEELEDTKFLNKIIKSFEETLGSVYEGQDFHLKFAYLNMGASITGYFDPSGGVLTAYNTLRAVQV